MAAAAALIAYAAAARLGGLKRTVVALVVFFTPLIVATWAFLNMDQPPPDAVNVEFGNEPTHEPAPADCEQLMRAYESNTEDKQALKRLDAECPGWESMR